MKSPTRDPGRADGSGGPACSQRPASVPAEPASVSVPPVIERIAQGLTLGLFVGLVLGLFGCDTLLPQRSPGEKLYRRYCAECHGFDGAGNTPRYMGNPWADLTDNNWKYGGDPVAIEAILRQGIFGQMPSFDHLSNEELRAIVAYLREVRGEASPSRAR